jgi:polyhydroxyalkanoate synthesis regulator phasin
MGMAKAVNDSIWTPLTDAVDRARALNDEATKLARRTVADVRGRTEAALKEAQKRSRSTLKVVRKQIASATSSVENTVEQQRTQIADLVEGLRKQLKPVEDSVIQAIEKLAKNLNLATGRDVDSLRRKLTSLERRVNDLMDRDEAA